MHKWYSRWELRNKKTPKVWDVSRPDLSLLAYHQRWLDRQATKGKRITVT